MASTKERRMNLVDPEERSEWMSPLGGANSEELLEPPFYTLPWVTSHDLIPLTSDVWGSQRFAYDHEEVSGVKPDEVEGFP